jgi:hypothetical protein
VSPNFARVGNIFHDLYRLRIERRTPVPSLPVLELEINAPAVTAQRIIDNLKIVKLDAEDMDTLNSLYKTKGQRLYRLRIERRTPVPSLPVLELEINAPAATEES